MTHGVPSNLLKVLYAAYIVFEVLRAFMIFFSISWTIRIYAIHIIAAINQSPCKLIVKTLHPDNSRLKISVLKTVNRTYASQVNNLSLYIRITHRLNTLFSHTQVSTNASPM